jgi:hypothetical protein
MFSQNHLLVTAHIDSMLKDAANERLARKTSTARTAHPGFARLTASANGVLKNVWSLLTGPADRPMFATGSGQSTTILPNLSDYPYRG